jgi:hypothetical protein
VPEQKITTVEEEKCRRICVALWAYAYEIKNDSLVSDAKYDATAKSIRPKIKTGNKVLDKFFREEFNPSTGVDTQTS